jgi:hypothetical protein
MLSELINSGREYIVASYIQSFIKDYAEVVSVSLNTYNRSMEFRVRLIGESDITLATVLGYKILKDEFDNTFFCYEEFLTTKPWVNKLVNNYSYLVVKNKQFEIPHKWVKKTLPFILGDKAKLKV